MNNSISGSLVSLLVLTTTVVGVTAKPQAGLAQPKSASLEAKLAKAANVSPAIAPEPAQEAVKVGEQLPELRQVDRDETIAKIYSHELSGKQAATLYVRNIPVLTFVSSQAAAAAGVKMGAVQSEELSPSEKTKSVSTDARGLTDSSFEQVSSQSASTQSDPTVRASEIAAQLNQLYREGLDPNKISVSWQSLKGSSGQASGEYVIKANGSELFAIDPQTIALDNKQNLEQDALQVANRLRRLFGDAAPLSHVEGKPSFATLAMGNVVETLKGWASWYGPGFDGNLTASGEVFNQNALTAAHPYLPLGTQVRVTNLDTGKSVVVKINDRGPYAAGRILDLSAGAARLIGVIDSGVAPVRLDVLGR